MWKCKKCGGEVFAEVEVHSNIEFNIGEDGDITDPSTGFTLEEIVRDDTDVVYYYCDSCGKSSEIELEDIAEWIDE